MAILAVSGTLEVLGQLPVDTTAPGAMSGPKTSAAISAHLDQAAAGSSGVCTRLSWAAGSAVVYPAWTSPVDSVTYSSFTIPWPPVQAVVERLDLYVAPLVNADGRDSSSPR